MYAYVNSNVASYTEKYYNALCTVMYLVLLLPTQQYANNKSDSSIATYALSCIHVPELSIA